MSLNKDLLNGERDARSALVMSVVQSFGTEAEVAIGLRMLTALRDAGALREVAQGMETAPRDRPILVWHNPTVAETFTTCLVEQNEFETLLRGSEEPVEVPTVYGMWVESLRKFEVTGWHVAVWGGGYDETDWETGHNEAMPDWWFLNDGNLESALWPLCWAELPTVPREMGSENPVDVFVEMAEAVGLGDRLNHETLGKMREHLGEPVSNEIWKTVRHENGWIEDRDLLSGRWRHRKMGDETWRTGPLTVDPCNICGGCLSHGHHGPHPGGCGGDPF